MKSSEIKTLVRNLFQIVSGTSIVPPQWMECKIHVVPKDPENPWVDQRKFINLFNILRRIFEKMLLRYWETENPRWLRLNPNQAGFRRGYSTLTHILTEDEMTRQGFPISVFLDLKSAYGWVPWKGMLWKLFDRGIPPQDGLLLKNLLLSPANLQLSINRESYPQRILTQRDLFQESPLSPILFTIFIDDLAASLDESALLFADDILFKCRNEEEASRNLEICQE
eukprot:Sdes_comp19340_c0_seq1m10547